MDTSWSAVSRANYREAQEGDRQFSLPCIGFVSEAVGKCASGKWFFPSSTGKRWDPDNYSQDLRAISDPAGLVWSCLDFRHTFGSHLAQEGESLFKIATLLGNSPEICRRHYAALIPEGMHDVVEFAHPKMKKNFEQDSTNALLKQSLAENVTCVRKINRTTPTAAGFVPPASMPACHITKKMRSADWTHSDKQRTLFIIK